MKIKFLKLILVFIYIFAISIPVEASSISWPGPKAEITSPFGPRANLGSGTFHYGVDIGYDYGTKVQAVADGIIDFYGEASGFEYAAFIWHPELGIGSLYGDMELVNGLYPGQHVKKGDVIGVIAPVGVSTGAHLHFQLQKNRVPFPGAAAGAFDPLPYLEGAEVAQNADSFWETDAAFSSVDWNVIADIASSVRETIDALVTASTKAVEAIRPHILWMFLSIATISLALTGINMMFSDNENIEGIFKMLLSKAILYGFFAFLIANWSAVLNMVKDFFTTAGAVSMNTTTEAAGAAVSDPTMIIQKGANLTAPFFNYVGSYHSSIAIAFSWPTIVFVFILGLAILGMFLLIGIQVMLSYIEFYIVCVFSIFDIAWSRFKSITYLPFVGNGINAVFAVSIKLMWYIFFTLMLSIQLTNANFGEMTTTGSRSAVNLEQAGPEAITVFMSAVKMQESTDNYYIYSDDGYGYGAYQINFDNWNAWVAEAGLAADYDWVPHDDSSMQRAWSPDRQDTVARFKMMQYYQQYGSWRAVAEAWHGGSGNIGSSDSYADSVFAKAGEVLPDPTFDLIKGLKIFFYTLIFFLLGSKVSSYIIQTFGSTGFRFR